MSRFSRMTWMNPPVEQTDTHAGLEVVTGEKTDFWRETFYGFVRHNGHFLWETAQGDFTAEVTISGNYRALYDQAGLMMLLSDQHWIKCGVEVNDGQPVFSTVITNLHSDWATMPLPFDATKLRLRLTRHAEAVRVDVANPAGGWILARLGYLPAGLPAKIGIMACSPERARFRVTFSDYRCGPAIPRALHEGH